MIALILAYDIQMDRSMCESISRLALLTHVPAILKDALLVTKNGDRVMQRADTFYFSPAYKQFATFPHKMEK